MQQVETKENDYLIQQHFPSIETTCYKSECDITISQESSFSTGPNLG